MPRWQPDEVDIWCNQWAHQRRLIFGIVDAIRMEPRERLGKLKSTLGAVREDREGAGQGAVSQNFPEVYTGTPLLVHRAWCEMNREWREVVNIHYVLRELKAKVKAHECGVSLPLYWKRLEFGKSFIQSFVILSTKMPRSNSKVMETQNIAEIVG